MKNIYYSFFVIYDIKYGLFNNEKYGVTIIPQFAIDLENNFGGFISDRIRNSLFNTYYDISKGTFYSSRDNLSINSFVINNILTDIRNAEYR